MALCTVSAKGSIVIPQEIREQYGIRPADRVEVIDIGGRVMIVPIPHNPTRAARGMLVFRGSAAEMLQTLRAEERRRDRRKLQ